MAKKTLNEFKTEKEALSGADYDAWVVSLKEGQKNYSGLLIGNYHFLYPVLVDKYSSSFPSSGWMCKNTQTGLFKIIPELAARKMYLNNCSDYSYFGVKLIKENMTYILLNEKQYKEEFIHEALVFNKGGKEYADEYRKHYSNDEEVQKYIDNLRRNFDYFKALRKPDFEKEVCRVVQQYHFKEVNDLSKYKNCLYLVTLDNYSQYYVGKSAGSLSSRMRKHWTAKIIPSREIWSGGFEHSRLKFDDFKMLDNTRFFVCDDIDLIIKENQNLASNPRIEHTNLFSLEYFENMVDLDKAERIVINDCLCMFCLSDRTPIITCPRYEKLYQKYNVDESTIKIKHYLCLDEYKQLERTPRLIAFINSLKKKK